MRGIHLKTAHAQNQDKEKLEAIIHSKVDRLSKVERIYQLEKERQLNSRNNPAVRKATAKVPSTAMRAWLNRKPNFFRCVIE